MSLAGLLGRGFGFDTIAGSGSTPLTLSLVDQADGTGATATIGDSSGGVVTIYTSTFSGTTPPTWATSTTRIGDGTADIVLTNGTYWVYAAETGAGVSPPTTIVVTGGVVTTNCIPIRIADAVVTQINAATLSIGAITAVRSSGSWDKDFTGLAESSTPSVDVLYRKRGSSMSMNTQNSILHTVEIIIVARKRFAATDRITADGEILVASVDPLDTLMVETATLFHGRRLTPGSVLDDESGANLISDEITPSFANEHFLRRGLYYAFVPLVFTLREDV